MRETGTELGAPSIQGPEWGAADYEILAELSAGPLGRIRLASIVRGRDAGRLVRLRGVPYDLAPVLSRSVEIGARVAHARLLKVLGLAVVDGELNVASEFVEGATLWELSRAAIEQKRPVAHAVALRIVSDLLHASVAARNAFRHDSAIELGRCIWPDTAWIAAFGEALLTEPGVAATLALGAEAAEPYLTPEETRGELGGAASDVFAAGVLLWELFANRSLFAGGAPEHIVERVSSEPIERLGTTGNFGELVPAEVIEIVDRALSRDLAERYSGPKEMLVAIARLPPRYVASDEDVQSVLEDLVHIEQQRRTNSSFVPVSGSHEVLWDIPTRSLRVPRGLLEEDRVTLRPSMGALSPSLLAARGDTSATETPAAPALDAATEPERVPAPRSRWWRAVALTALGLGLALALAAGAHYFRRGPKLGAVSTASPEMYAGVPAVRDVSRARPERVLASPSAATRTPAPLPDAAAADASSENAARTERGYRPRSIGPYRPKGI